MKLHMVVKYNNMIKFYRLMLTSISTYRGSTSVFDYMGGGIIAGTLYQLKIGPRGMIVGGTLGKRMFYFYIILM